VPCARWCRPACGPPTRSSRPEAAQTGSGDGERAVLVLGFESTRHVEHDLQRALELCRAHGAVSLI
jgi:hypothetical protein